MPVEKYSTLLPQKSPKRIIKGKLLTALGATGVLLPYPQNPEHILERKILLQTPFNTNPSGGGVVSNGLLTNLTAYWKFDETVGTSWADATGNGWTGTTHGAFITHDTGGIINGCVHNGGASNGASGVQVSALIDNRAATTPFSISLWFTSDGAVFPVVIMSVEDFGANSCWALYASDASGGGTGAGFLHFKTVNAAAVVTGVTSPTTFNTGGADNSNFNHVLAGYDGTNIFLILNNGVKQTAAVTGVRRGLVPLVFTDESSYGGNGTAGNWGGKADECAYWTDDKSSKISLLYNGGTALPFSSFS